ncbi:MAG: hypothetical protein QXM51_01535 [Thermoproteota archaeon]
MSKFNKAFERRETRDKIFEAMSKPKLAVIVNEETEDLREAVDSLPFESNVVESSSFFILQHNVFFSSIQNGVKPVGNV